MVVIEVEVRDDDGPPTETKGDARFLLGSNHRVCGIGVGDTMPRSTVITAEVREPLLQPWANHVGIDPS